jgi:hypothetical protein
MEIVMYGGDELAKTSTKHKCMTLPLYQSAPYSTFKHKEEKKTRNVNVILFFNFCAVVLEPTRFQHHGKESLLFMCITTSAGQTDTASS